MQLVSKTVDHLPEHALLSALDAGQLERMRISAEHHQLDAGDLLFHAGENASRFFVLESGQIKLHRVSPSGQEKIIELMSAPAAFAEAVMFMQPRVYPVSCEALTMSHIVGLSMDEFRAIIDESPATVMRLLHSLSLKLHKRVEDIEALSSQNATLRVVSYILSLVADTSADNARIELPFSKKSVAARLSLQPETLSRTFARLKAAGLINVDGNAIEVTSVAAVRELALTGRTTNLKQ